MNDSERIILEKIKNLRNQKGISQTKLADAIGISQTGYAKIERGDTENIPLSVAVGIAKALNVGFNELFDIDGDSQKIDGLNGQIEELKAKIEELKERIGEKDLLIKSFINKIKNMSDYLIHEIHWKYFCYEWGKLENKYQLIDHNDENELKKFEKEVDHVKEVERDEYSRCVSNGTLEQHDIDEYFEFKTRQYERMLKEDHHPLIIPLNPRSPYIR